MNKIRSCIDYINALLEKEFEDIKWEQKVLAPVVSKETTGYIYLDDISFKKIDKMHEMAEVVCCVDIYSTNPKMEAWSIEDLALDVRKCLMKNRTFGNWAYDSYCDDIVFGTPQGMNKIGRAIIFLKIQIVLEE